MRESESKEAGRKDTFSGRNGIGFDRRPRWGGKAGLMEKAGGGREGRRGGRERGGYIELVSFYVYLNNVISFFPSLQFFLSLPLFYCVLKESFCSLPRDRGDLDCPDLGTPAIPPCALNSALANVPEDIGKSMPSSSPSSWHLPRTLVNRETCYCIHSFSLFDKYSCRSSGDSMKEGLKSF